MKFFKSLLGSGNQTLSSKRFTGIICVISLVVALFVSMFSDGNYCANDELVDAIALLAFGCLGLTSTEAIFGKKYDTKKDGTQEEV
jgi:uncharacterized membrane protein YeiH